jgi:hypothetical protein
MTRTKDHQRPFISDRIDADINDLARRLSENWAHADPSPRGAGGQIMQRLAHGRERAVTVEIKRSRRRQIAPESMRSFDSTSWRAPVMR